MYRVRQHKSWKIQLKLDVSQPDIVRQVEDLFRRLFSDDRVLSHYFRYDSPPRSLDLNPHDYWLWRYLKSQVYRDRQISIRMPKEDIRRLFLAILTNILQRAVHDNVS